MGGPEASNLAVDLPALRGRRVLLRQPLHADVAVRVEVPREPEEHLMYGGSGEPKVFTEAEVRTQLDEYMRQDLAKRRAFVIAAQQWPDGKPVREPHGRYIGTIRLHGIAWEDRKAHLAIGIFDRRFWSCGFGTEAVRLLLNYAFEQLRLHRIDLRVLNYNTRAIRCYEKCGFTREGLERESALVNGRWHSDVIMGILEDEYRSQPWANEL
jgi:[ribosomal protein S5]-alanine N-acetyltransferase